jgi:hypothetical protein
MHFFHLNKALSIPSTGLPREGPKGSLGKPRLAQPYEPRRELMTSGGKSSPRRQIIQSTRGGTVKVDEEVVVETNVDVVEDKVAAVEVEDSVEDICSEVVVVLLELDELSIDDVVKEPDVKIVDCVVEGSLDVSAEVDELDDVGNAVEDDKVRAVELVVEIVVKTIVDVVVDAAEVVNEVDEVIVVGNDDDNVEIDVDDDVCGTELDGNTVEDDNKGVEDDTIIVELAEFVVVVEAPISQLSPEYPESQVHE